MMYPFHTIDEIQGLIREVLSDGEVFRFGYLFAKLAEDSSKTKAINLSDFHKALHLMVEAGDVRVERRRDNTKIAPFQKWYFLEKPGNGNENPADG